ncbi:MAG TPA: hypothetical protein VFI31_01800 [Pirellulales bacterium]|nr:hypothetical protein [Pirellulales bacterium]
MREIFDELKTASMVLALVSAPSLFCRWAAVIGPLPEDRNDVILVAAPVAAADRWHDFHFGPSSPESRPAEVGSTRGDF